MVSRFDEIKTIICDTFHLDADALRGSTPFDELGVDSRKRVRMLATLETHFDLSIGVDELERLVDLNGVTEVIREALAARDHPPHD